ncbi:MAG: ACT domain-containing protein [Archaeoglobus sp.]|uniref:ACT domain-containing protein n=1 Tax=Archaeoglobus sp. TaxID=1872626 RepID=UPI001DA32B94|nr:ACT domain-containing protein [Archaeoglobus sp.]MBO8180090.1 ACT domain-containing protein [Archaeoglobus sp.]
MIKQISVFVENKPGRLAAVTEVLTKHDINIRAFTIADAGDFGIIRMVVDKTDEAYKALKEAGFTVRLTDVLAVEVEDKPGALHRIARALGDAGVNIDYVYAFTSEKHKALIIFRVNNKEKAKEVLENLGVLFKGEIS